jgi:hypothetical protein
MLFPGELPSGEAVTTYWIVFGRVFLLAPNGPCRMVRRLAAGEVE